MTERIGRWDISIVDPDTGETISFEEFLVDYLENYARKFNFQQAGTGALASMIELIPNTGAKVLGYLIRNKTAGNLVKQTNKRISEDLGVSINSVSSVMVKFVKAGFIRRVDRGIYMINPDILSYGGPSGNFNRKSWGEAK